jgi:hypothetical protein
MSKKLRPGIDCEFIIQEPGAGDGFVSILDYLQCVIYHSDYKANLAWFYDQLDGVEDAETIGVRYSMTKHPLANIIRDYLTRRFPEYPVGYNDIMICVDEIRLFDRWLPVPCWVREFTRLMGVKERPYNRQATRPDGYFPYMMGDVSAAEVRELLRLCGACAQIGQHSHSPWVIPGEGYG